MDFMGFLARLLILATIGVVSIPTFAAEIKIIENGDAQRPAIISIEGPLLLNDDRAFAQVALTVESAIVIMSSDGGNLRAGIQIGKAIRLKEFDTLVMKNFPCASACALAWLGGGRRLMEPGSQVGFHAAYREEGGKIEESGVGNALAGSYLNQLGLPERAIAYITSTAPQSIQWLTVEDARNNGVDVISFEVNSSNGKSATIQPSKVYKISEGMDLFGLDLPNMPLRDMAMDTCQSACSSNSACKAFTFNRKSSTCFLKSGATFSVGYEFAVAGYPSDLIGKINHSAISIHQRTDVVGSDYQHNDGVSLERCIRDCDENTRCRAFTYIAKKQQCWLKSALGTLKSKKGVVSGLK